MKICACVAEYNPFHLGHKKHIEYMRNELKAEYVVAVMSGNFTQRGEPAVLDKFTRAKHAVLSGADAVIELPTVFATANAENFAKGAVNLLADLCVPFGLCFGAESGDKQNYISLAEFLNEESKEFKAVLKQKLDKGVSFAKAKCETVKELGKDARLMSSPNNALGVEYTRAMLKRGLTDVYPMPREGDHNDATLKKGITSASSIREAVKSGGVKKVKKCVPDFVYKDLNSYPADYDKICLSHIILSSAEELEIELVAVIVGVDDLYGYLVAFQGQALQRQPRGGVKSPCLQGRHDGRLVPVGVNHVPAAGQIPPAVEIVGTHAPDQASFGQHVIPGVGAAGAVVGLNGPHAVDA